MALELSEAQIEELRKANEVAEREFQAFHAILGEAITRWQHVEVCLEEIFFELSGCRSRDVSRAIFFAPKDFSEKLNMTDRAARIVLDKDSFEKIWRPLRNKLQHGSECRNSLAHFFVTKGTRLYPDRSEPYMDARPNIYDPNEKYKHRKDDLKSFDRKKISKWLKSFHNLTGEIGRFVTELRESGALPAERTPPLSLPMP